MTKQQSILNHLYRYGFISPQTAYEKYHTWRLAHHIERMRKQGLKIKTVMKTGKTGTRYCDRYVLGQS